MPAAGDKPFQPRPLAGLEPHDTRLGHRGLLAMKATVFRDFAELCKMATLGFYQGVLGEHLQPEHLYPAKVAVRQAAGTKPAG